MVVAELSSFAFSPDFIWLNSLIVPTYVPPGWLFTLMITVTYASVVWVISRLVVGRHIFPSMLLFCALGFCVVMFVYLFFTKKEIYAGAFFIAAVLALSVTLTIRFLIKDPKLALIYLPTLIFHCYAFVTVVGVAMYN